MRKIISSAVTCLVACCLLSGCGANGKISPPFSADERTGYSMEEAVSAFEGAGFNNISTESVSSVSSRKIGMVDMITVDGSYTFTKYNSYKPDCPVVISYYVELEKTEQPTVDPDQRYADRLNYSLEQYRSMKDAFVSCGVSATDVHAAMRIGSHEAALTLDGHSFTVSFGNDFECVKIYNSDAVFYESGEVLLSITEYLE